MNKKTIKALAVIFIGLLLIIFELNWLDKSAGKKNVVKADFSLEEIKEDSTQKITVLKSGAKNEIVKSGDSWESAGAKKTPEEMKSFFDALGNAKIKSIASKNAKNEESFGLKGAEVIELVITDKNGKEKSFLIGKTAADGGFYVKAKDGKAVYAAEGEIRSAIEALIKKPEEAKKADKK